MNRQSDLAQRIASYRLSDPMVVLIGPMGAGKTTIGRYLAKHLNKEFIDLYYEIEKTADQHITDIFEREGEAGFRQRETAALERYCYQSGTIISTGGGAILCAENRKMLRAGIVVYLHATPQQQYQRIKNRTNRPNFDPDRPLERLTELMIRREPLYRAEADIIVHTDNLTVDSIVRIIE